jgi:hypothetical protein
MKLRKPSILVVLWLSPCGFAIEIVFHGPALECGRRKKLINYLFLKKLVKLVN